MFGEKSILTRMAALVTVRDVYTPLLTRFPAGTLSQAARAQWQHMCSGRVSSSPLDHVCIVEDGAEPIGWLDFCDLVYEPTADVPVSELMTKITAKQLVSADTSLLDAAELFTRASPFGFLVLQRSELVGLFSYHDLLSVPFRACLFSFLCLIEESISKVLITDSKLALSKLSKSDYDRLVRRWNRTKRCPNRLTPSMEDLIHLSFFSQKLQMLQSCAAASRTIDSLNSKRLKLQRRAHLGAGGTRYEDITQTTFRVTQLKQLRNALAHSASGFELPILLPKDDLRDFMVWVRSLESQLTEYGTHETLKD